MGSFSTGIGLISGIDSAALIEQILMVEARGRLRLEGEIASLQVRQSSMLEVNARLLGLESAVNSLLSSSSFGAMQAMTSHADVLSVSASSSAQPGSWSFIVDALATRHQVLTGGHASSETSLGLESLSLEFGGGSVSGGMDLSILNGGIGVDRGRIEITLGSGSNSTIHVVDCRNIVTVQDVIDRIGEVDSSLSITRLDTAFRLETSDGRAISVRSLDDATTAADLGLQGDGSSGVLAGRNVVLLGASTSLSSLNDELGVLFRDGTPDLRITTQDGRTFDVDIPSTAGTLQDVLDAINDANDSGGIANDGAVIVRIASDGLRLEVEDTTSGSGSFSILATGGNPHAVFDLGIQGTAAGSVVTGERLLAGLDSVLLSNLHGGAGLAAGQSMQLVDRAGNAMTLQLDAGIESFGQMINSLNSQVDLAGGGVRFELNSLGNGLRVIDDTGINDPGSNLTITGSLATTLGIEADAAVSVIEGQNLQHRYVGEATALADLNGGHGVGTGSFTIRDATGQIATVEVTDQHRTVDDLLTLIESKGLAISARINEQGDGILIESNASEEASTVTLRIETAGGTTAADLNLLGESSELHGAGAIIDGYREFSIDVDSSTTLSDLVDRINDMAVPVQASLVNAGGGATPWRLSLTSDRQGQGGQFILDGRLTDGTSLDASTTIQGQDARIFVGDDPADGLLVQSNQNSISGVIAGLVLDLHAASSTPVIVTVDRNDEVALDAIHGFVDAFNQVVDLLRSVDSYDIESGAKGALLGDPTVARVSRAMYDLVLQELETGGGFNGLWEVGIRMGAAGHLELDEAVLSEALTSNRAGVEALFLADDGDMQGYAVRFDALLESLTATEGGLLSVADDRFADQIESTSAGIARLDMRLDARRSRLVAQFVAMEQAIAVLQSQNAALLSLQSALFASSDG